jgi:hypothetical protein
MSIARKFAIPAAITAAVTGAVSATAVEPLTHHRDSGAPARATPRRARTVDLLAHSGFASPDTFNRCQSSTQQHAYVCLYVQGHSNYVSFMSAYGCADIGITAHTQIVSPALGATLANSKTKKLGTGNWACTSSAVWAPFNKANTGPYVARLWNKKSSGYNLVVSTYVNVE